MKFTFKSNICSTSLLVVAVTLGGCATHDPRDPLEPLNRGIYRFNDTVDKAVIKPVAQGYRAVLPTPVRSSVSNFFSNIDDIFVTANNLLQFKFKTAASDFSRLLANSTLGIGGLFDVATSFGLEKHDEDLGQTLGYWGIGDGPFLMIPLAGPSTVRDAVGSAVQSYYDPIWNLNDVATRNSLAGLRVVSDRANLLDAEKVLDEAALDPYNFLRDAYLQQRRSLIYDGNPPRENLGDLDDEPLNKKSVSSAETTDKAATAPLSPAPVTANAEAPSPAQIVEEKIEAAGDKAAAKEATSDKAVDAAPESNGFASLLVSLFGGADATAGQE